MAKNVGIHNHKAQKLNLITFIMLQYSSLLEECGDKVRSICWCLGIRMQAKLGK
jgi:hypothetical protein